MKSDRRPCRVCGLDFRPVRFDALTCSDPCRKRRSRGQDLAYLAAMAPDQARARRSVHEALISDIEIRKMVIASRRERRADRKRSPRCKE
jgi:predicted nucleic acid-binding Zn ribbon protein